MKHLRKLVLCALMAIPLPCFAEHDYNDDFTKAVAAHYPPLIRLIITKGATQNTQDLRADTPLMQAIRSGDREITELLLRYQPKLSLLNADNHSAATEAVAADDADSLTSVLIRDDQLQLAQSFALAVKLGKRRVLTQFAAMLGPASDEIARSFLKNPLPYFQPGSQVALAFSPSENRPDVCGKPISRLLLQGRICKVEGDQVAVEWQAISNLYNDDAQCSPQKHLRFEQKADAAWNAKYLGTCGVPPRYFTNVPASFDYRHFIIPELR